MAKELKEILSECMREAGSIEDLAERLTSAGVTFAPAENAECEIRNAELRVAGKIFAEAHNMLVKIMLGVDEGLTKAIALDDEKNKLAYSAAKESVRAIILCFGELKKKYTEGGEKWQLRL
jgi:hypothetical protein